MTVVRGLVIAGVAMVMVMVIAVGTVSASGEGWYDVYNNRVAVTVDPALLGSDLEMFPVALFITDSSGLGGDDMTFVFDEVGADYAKVAVTAEDGITLLYTEVECWDAVNEQAVLWVSPDLSSAENNTVYLYYDATAPDNPRIGWTGTAAAEAVWDSSFVGVWHMADNPADSDQILDSTSNENTGTKNGGMGAASWQDVGMGQVFDGTDDYVNCGNDDSLAINRTTVMVNTQIYQQPGLWRAIIDREYNYQNGYCLRFATSTAVDTDVEFKASKGTERKAAIADAPNYELVTLTGRYDGSEINVFWNAIHKGTTSSIDGIYTGSANLYIGRYYVAGYNFNGTISEVRISNIARSDNWIAATHLSNTDALVTFSGDVESAVRVDGVPLLIWVSMLIGAIGSGLHCWIDTENEKHLQIVTGFVSMIVFLWVGTVYAAGGVIYYLDDGLHVLQDEVMPWVFGAAAVIVGIYVAAYFVELLYGGEEEIENKVV